MSDIILARQFRKAKKDGRICKRCGWMITVKNWKAGHKLCAGCYSALKGVNVSFGSYPYEDEPKDLTGEM